MRENELHSAPGARKDRRRVGRGDSSGRGSYSGKGQKGEKSRSGHGIPRGFEGGQNKFIKRMPHKRGFTNLFRIEYEPVNVAKLAGLAAGTVVSPETLKEAGIIKSAARPIAILGVGEVAQALTVRAHRVSARARQKITGAGGTVEDLPAPTIARPR